MVMKALKMLRSFDDFGHKIHVSYKGKESYQTFCGGFFTIVSRIIVLIAIIKAAEEVILMKEPQINSIERFQSIEDRDSIGEIRLSDLNYFIGIDVIVMSG